MFYNDLSWSSNRIFVRKSKINHVQRSLMGTIFSLNGKSFGTENFNFYKLARRILFKRKKLFVFICHFEISMNPSKEETFAMFGNHRSEYCLNFFLDHQFFNRFVYQDRHHNYRSISG